MGKKLKVGKQRKDKFYRLAKECGFRSRAAFKLIQLNQKFGFLERSRVIIDLGAAPGGWLQVASKHMPLSGALVGVDLFPIRPIQNATTIQGDFTTDGVLGKIKKAAGGNDADLVLHDGSPNLGQAWSIDAFGQARLVLVALRIATQLLKRGGWFVTKLFRSVDYFKIIAVLSELFEKVHQTKPQASRQESAETFIVCERYRAPSRVDPKLLDPAVVFAASENGEASSSTSAASKPFSLNDLYGLCDPKRARKVQAKSLDESEPADSAFHPLQASAFVAASSSDEFVSMLRFAHSIILDVPAIRDHPLTSPAIRTACADLRSINRVDLKNLLKWRKALHNEQISSQIASEGSSEPVSTAPTATRQEQMEVDEETRERQLDEQIEELRRSELHDERKRSKKARLRELKQKKRLKSSLLTPGGEKEQLDASHKTVDKIADVLASNPVLDAAPLDDMELFSLHQLKRKNRLNPQLAASSANEMELVEANGELDDSAFEHAADELVREEREQYEEEAERGFVERSLTREEIQRRNTVRFQKGDEADYTEYEQEFVPEQKEFDANEQYDKVQEMISGYESKLISLRNLKSKLEMKNSRKKKLRAEANKLLPMGGAEQRALRDAGSLEAATGQQQDELLSMGQRKVDAKIARLEKMVNELQDRRRRRYLPDGTESHAHRNDEDAIPWSSEEEEEDNDDDHIGGNERAIEDEESDESAAEIESEDEDDARVPPSGRHEIQSDDEDAELEMDLEFLENHFKANQTAQSQAKRKTSDLSPSDDEESAPQQNTDDIDAADEEQIEGQQQQQKRTNPRNLEPLDKFADDNEDEHFEDVDEVQPAAAAPKEGSKQTQARKKVLILSPEELAIGEEIVKSRKRRAEIFDNAFNRRMFNDREEGLPDWFVRDEKIHLEPNLPITREQVETYREQMRALSARPIKKVVEARARRKTRAKRVLAKIQKRTEEILNDPEVEPGAKEHNKELQKLYKRVHNLETSQRRSTLVVNRRGKRAVGSHVRRPKGVRGKFKLVDSRLKKDTRREKALAKKGGRKTNRKKAARNRARQQRAQT